MANEPVPSPAPQPKKKSNHHDFDQQVEADLCQGETTLNAAINPLFKPTLLSAGIKEIDFTGLDTHIKDCRNASSKAVQASKDAGSLHIAEGIARGKMAEVIAVVRKAAKDKFKEGDPARKKYFVGLEIDGTKYQDLVQWLDALKLQLASDPLSDVGVSADEVAAILSSIIAWDAAHKAAIAKEDEATAWRTQRDTLQGQVNDTRHRLQSAADRKWPYTNPDNATTRAKFNLPLDREFNV